VSGHKFHVLWLLALVTVLASATGCGGDEHRPPTTTVQQSASPEHQVHRELTADFLRMRRPGGSSRDTSLPYMNDHPDEFFSGR
jgi:hypothetical protein